MVIDRQTLVQIVLLFDISIIMMMMVCTCMEISLSRERKMLTCS